MGNVIAVCLSAEKGTQKTNVGSATFVADWGIQGDAHAGKWHRQVSLLSYDKIEAFRARGAEVTDGAFGENLVVSGIDFRALPLGTKFRCNDVILELTHATMAARSIKKWVSVSCPVRACSPVCSTAAPFPWAIH